MIEARQGGFSPLQVPEVAAGYFWDPATASGSGAAGFLLPEGNGKSTHDLITPASGTAPTIATINGQTVISYTNGSPDRISRTASVQRGFTGSMGFGGWFSMSSAMGSVAHGRAAGLSLGIQFTSGDARVLVHDGVSLKETRFPVPNYAAGPFHAFAGFDSAEATATARTKLWIDGVAQVPSLTASPGTSVNDPTDVIAMGAGSSTDSSTFNITADWSHGVIVLTDGLLSATHLALLVAYKALK